MEVNSRNCTLKVKVSAVTRGWGGGGVVITKDYIIVHNMTFKYKVVPVIGLFSKPNLFSSKLVSPFPGGDHKAAINRGESMTNT